MNKFLKPSAKTMLFAFILFLAVFSLTSLMVALTEVSAGAISAIAALVFVSLFAAYLIYGYSRLIKEYFSKNGGVKKVARLYKSDLKEKTLINNSFTAVYAVLFGVYEYVLAFAEHSVFFLSVSGVYFTIGTAKIYLITKQKEIENNTRKINLILSALFLFISAAVSGITVLVYHLEGGFSHQGMVIYAVAAYSFYVFVSTIVSTVKRIKDGQTFVHTFLRIKHVNSLYSVFTLTVSMLHAFCSDAAWARVFSLYMGAAMAFFILAYAVYTFVLGIKTPKKTG